MDVINSNDRVAMPGTDGMGVIVVDRSRKILFKNGSAEIVLSRGGSLVERHGMLASRTPGIELRLREAMQGAASSPARLVHLPRASGLPLIGLIVPLPTTIAEELGALVLLWDPQAMAVPRADMLRQFFGLTPAETVTALAMYEGQTPAEIADSRQRSVATVRTLLSRAFLKCGVKRQAELVKLLAGIESACSFTEGIRTGMDIQRAIQHPVYQHAAQRHVQEIISRQLAESPDMEALVRITDFAPGQGTTSHYHTHGHEVLCVLRGNLTTKFGADEIRVTPPGQARYIAENVIHRGFNQELRGPVQVLSINVTQRGKSSRVDVPEAFG